MNRLAFYALCQPFCQSVRSERNAEERSRRRGGTLALLLAFLLLPTVLGCSSLISVKVAYDPSVEFADYETFAMAQPNKAVPTDADSDPFVHRRLRQLAFEQFSERGYVPASKKEADFVVYVLTGSRQRWGTMPGSYMGGPYFAGRYGYGYPGWGPGWGFGFSTARVVDENLIVVDLVDPRENTVLWRGKGVVRGSSLDDKDLREAISGILARFPPERS